MLNELQSALKTNNIINRNPCSIKTLQHTIDANLQKIRIEQLLMEVDRETGFTQCFTPLPGHHTKPTLFYKTLIAAIIALSTNLGVVAMANSTDGITVDMLRHVIDYYIREENSASSKCENRRLPPPITLKQCLWKRINFII